MNDITAIENNGNDDVRHSETLYLTQEKQQSMYRTVLPVAYIPVVTRLGIHPYGKTFVFGCQEFSSSCFDFLRMYYGTTLTVRYESVPWSSTFDYFVTFGPTREDQIVKMEQDIAKLKQELTKKQQELALLKGCT
jgi:hypothetical protein